MGFQTAFRHATARSVAAALTAIGLAVAAHPAQAAACINTTPILPPAAAQGAGSGCGLTATGTSVQLVFAYVSALSESTVGLFGNQIFDNKTSTPGTEYTISGLAVGEVLPFTFSNLTTGVLTYTNADPATSPDGEPHTAYAAASTGTGPLTINSMSLFLSDPPRNPVVLDPAVSAAMNAIDPNSADWLFVGFEDLTKAENSDFDYNDMVFAFNNDPVSASIPEPASLALLGSALVGLGMFHRRRKNA